VTFFQELVQGWRVLHQEHCGEAPTAAAAELGLSVLVAVMGGRRESHPETYCDHLCNKNFLVNTGIYYT